jgi:steroid 5-alpha reductase family enzyme
MPVAEATLVSRRRERARPFASAAARDLPMLVVLAAFLAEPSTREFALVNLLVQAVGFGLGACLPAYRTRVMAITDAVWPCGLAAIGVLALLFGDTGSPQLLVVAGIYLAMGLRGVVGGIYWTLTTAFPREELPRYRYRRLVWQREGHRSETAPMLHEILDQGLANSTVLAAPAMLAVADGHDALGAVAIAGALVWAVSWVLESVADLQKDLFARRCAQEGRARTCEVGLWRYSRHPNYFFEWLAWNGLIVAALPSLVRLADDFAVVPWLGFAAALAGTSAGMYYVLVHHTGAIPAEHFSAQRRPGYRDYQRRVNRFVPGPRRRGGPGVRANGLE